MIDLTGKQIGGYQITGLLGRGGMAAVYRATQIKMGREVALKVIDPALLGAAEFVKRFQREMQAAALLSHPHILKVFDYGEEEGIVYLVMELLDGGSVATLIDQGALPLPKITRILEQIGSALDYAHQKGIIHRDVKPQNILLDEAGNAFLMDFGIVKMSTETSSLTQQGSVVGTPSYIAPELWLGNPIDGRADIYSLGVVAYEMLTGRLPFRSDTLYSLMKLHVNEQPQPVVQLRTDLPPALGQVIERALAKSPARRYPTAAAFASDFQHAIAGTTPSSPPPTLMMPAASGEEGGTSQHPAAPASPAASGGALDRTVPMPAYSPGSAPTEKPSPLPPLPPKKAAPPAYLPGFDDDGLTTPVPIYSGGTPGGPSETQPLPAAPVAMPADPRRAPPPGVPAAAAGGGKPPLPLILGAVAAVLVIVVVVLVATRSSGPTDAEATGTQAAILALSATSTFTETPSRPQIALMTATFTPSLEPLQPTGTTPLPATTAAPTQETPATAEPATLEPTGITPTANTTTGAIVVAQPTASLTPTVVSSPTPTVTETATITATPTAILTLTASFTPSLTPPPSLTPTFTATATNTATVTATLDTNATATAQVTATARSITADVNAQIRAGKTLFGPQDGELLHGIVGDDTVVEVKTGLNLADMVIQAKFYNPYGADEGGWDYGFFFRYPEESLQYRFILRSKGDFALILRDGKSELVANAPVPGLRLNAGEANFVQLAIKGSAAHLFVNEVYIATLDVSARTVAGNVSVVTGVLTGNKAAGKVTRFEQFVVIGQ